MTLPPMDLVFKGDFKVNLKRILFLSILALPLMQVVELKPTTTPSPSEDEKKHPWLARQLFKGNEEVTRMLPVKINKEVEGIRKAREALMETHSEIKPLLKKCDARLNKAEKMMDEISKGTAGLRKVGTFFSSYGLLVGAVVFPLALLTGVALIKYIFQKRGNYARDIRIKTLEERLGIGENENPKGAIKLGV